MKKHGKSIDKTNTTMLFSMCLWDVLIVKKTNIHIILVVTSCVSVLIYYGAMKTLSIKWLAKKCKVVGHFSSIIMAKIVKLWSQMEPSYLSFWFWLYSHVEEYNDHM